MSAPFSFLILSASYQRNPLRPPLKVFCKNSSKTSILPSSKVNPSFSLAFLILFTHAPQKLFFDHHFCLWLADLCTLRLDLNRQFGDSAIFLFHEDGSGGFRRVLPYPPSVIEKTSGRKIREANLQSNQVGVSVDQSRAHRLRTAVFVFCNSRHMK